MASASQIGIECSGGIFLGNGKLIEIGTPKAKCARKKCSFCDTEGIFKDYSQDDDGFDKCTYLKCEEKQFMVINGALTIRPSQTVQCSAKTSVESDLTIKSKWVVGDNDKVEISKIECKDSVKCDQIHPLLTDCEKTDKICVSPIPNPSGVYECKAGYIMRVLQNDSLNPIMPPECDEKNATWIIKSNNSKLPEWRPEGNITINCIKDEEVAKIVTGNSSSSWTWLIILIVVILVIIIAIAIGAYCYLDKKKKKQKEAAAGSAPTKTSTTSKTSSKPSSDEKEPLTSQMKSVTADSIQTAIEQKPTVALTNADLRPVTAAASDPPTDKKEEKKSDPSKKDDKQSEKRKERVPKDPSSSNWGSTNDDTSRNTATSLKEKFAPMPKSAEDPLKSQTGGESQVEKVKNEESAKLLPKKGPPRKYKTSKSSGASTGAKATPNNDFLNVTDDEEDEPSKTGSKKRARRVHA